MERDLICIGCPLGCALHVSGDVQDLKVSGFTCPRGETYAITECTAPVRGFTGTVALVGGVQPVVSVKTAQDIPKEKILAVAEAVRGLRVEAPVYIGDVIRENIADTGVDLIATKQVACSAAD